MTLAWAGTIPGAGRKPNGGTEKLETEQKYKPEKGKIVVVPEIPDCDFCVMQDVRGIPGPYDFKTVHGPWAHGCEIHYVANRVSPNLGVGVAQLWITESQADTS